jgi:hypothetical protein
MRHDLVVATAATALSQEAAATEAIILLERTNREG